MKDFAVYGLFILAGFLAGGAFSLLKVSKFGAGILVVLAVLAAVGGVLQLVGEV
ncbi:hypothetical protein [Tomitella fengzijianii]|uniref:hypothetical protein n=1 Tax=Tomitella fengzijianii TaxID=2597660 RepID=UPI00143CF374|nr:hypothetical protein [Tomitella fengzijianii]